MSLQFGYKDEQKNLQKNDISKADQKIRGKPFKEYALYKIKSFLVKKQKNKKNSL